MSTFRVVLTPEAQSDLRSLDPASQTRILDKLEWVGDSADLLRHQAMRGDEWHGCFKYRVGDYRIIYQMAWPAKRVIVLKIGHRRDVYSGI
jgi:mRNA interferase RelE/StbE